MVVEVRGFPMPERMKAYSQQSWVLEFFSHAFSHAAER
jgi:hypothetical protein